MRNHALAAAGRLEQGSVAELEAECGIDVDAVVTRIRNRKK